MDPSNALRALSARYGAAADDGEFAAMAALFGDSGKLVTPGGVRTGASEIAEALAGLGRYDRTFHLVGQVRVWQDPEGWRGETYCTAHHFIAGGEPGSEAITDTVMHIRYHDRFVVNDAGPDGWLFGERRLDVVASGTQLLRP